MSSNAPFEPSREGAAPAAPPDGQQSPPAPQPPFEQTPPHPTQPYQAGSPPQPPYGQPPYGQVPGPPQAPIYAGYAGPVGVLSPQEERTWGMIAHLAPFAGGLIGLPFVGALVVFLMYKDRSPFVRRHALESLNFQITLLIGYLISFVLMLVLVGFVLLGILAIASIVLQIMAAVAANRGDEYRYPFTLRLIS